MGKVFLADDFDAPLEDFKDYYVMRLLLDTHTFLWFLVGDKLLSAKARQMIEDVDNEGLLSIASVWEISIKVSTGKLTLTEPMERLLPNDVFQGDRVSQLPYHHRAPFARMPTAQSLVAGLPLVSMDSVFDSYDVSRVW